MTAWQTISVFCIGYVVGHFAILAFRYWRGEIR